MQPSMNYIDHLDSINNLPLDARVVGSAFSSFDETTVISAAAISESIRSLEIIKCDACKTAVASLDVFVKGTSDVAFLKRLCEQCATAAKAVTATNANGAATAVQQRS